MQRIKNRCDNKVRVGGMTPEEKRAIADERKAKRKNRVEGWLQRVRLGDMAEAVIGVIPGIKKLPCHDKDGNLKPDSGCGKRKDWLNGEDKP